jgi:uncharacterized protein (DUF924 family)
MKKLPSNVFADSPLRSTDAEKPAAAPKGKGAQSKATLHVAPAPAADTGEAAPKAANDVNRTQTRKLTVYLPEESVQAIDDEVYLRRKAGDRSFSFADMHRELVEEWVARRAKRTRAPG